MVPKPDFDVDPATKLGAGVDWENGNDFESFVSALNSGTTLRSNGVEGVAELPRENELDETALLQLKHLFSNYR